MTVDVTFDATAVLVPTDAEKKVDGRVLIGPDRLVFATDERREAVPLESVFDVVDVPESPGEVRVGHESAGEKRVHGAVFADQSTTEAFASSLFTATLGGAAVRVRRRGVESGRLVVGSAGLRIEQDRGESLEITDVGTVRLSGDGQWILLTHGGQTTPDADPLAFALETSRQQHLAGRYFHWLRDRTDSAPSGPERTAEIRVLLVDDDGGFAEIASVFLPRENGNIVVETASDVESGLARLGDHPPVHCIVSDYRMPEASGLSFLKAVRDVSDDIPFIMLTGRGNENVAAEAVNHGATGYFVKDTDTAQFTTLAERIEAAVKAD